MGKDRYVKEGRVVKESRRGGRKRNMGKDRCVEKVDRKLCRRGRMGRTCV